MRTKQQSMCICPVMSILPFACLGSNVRLLRLVSAMPTMDTFQYMQMRT